MIKFPIQLIKYETKIEFIKKRYIAYILSALITALSVVSFFRPGLNLGIDFTGGVLVEVCSSKSLLSPDLARSMMRSLGYDKASIQSDDKENIIIRFQMQNYDNYSEEISNIKSHFSALVQDIEFRKVDYVGPKIGHELITNSIIAVILSLAAMMIYVMARFDWRFGLGIVIALFHDVLATIGFYAISRSEFDLTSIAAILTIIGYSVNDSVVIYDRIRENLEKHPAKETTDIINLSINETLSRTVMTVATTLVVCIALILFGGSSLQGLGMAIFFGIGFGTYSSIYISAPILTIFYKKTRALKQS